ncbi:cytochrome b [Acidocella sp.]|uniref:cytochrome b n=1 Tax=Acidocella sp. TaxID=50710 RepID=UPI00260A59AD|nr:cytochrome b/b6 domain-containing protein [Acidocella sp.]
MGHQAAMTETYTTPARLLHWLIAAFVLALIPVGFALKFDLVPDSTHRAIAALHISVGLTVLALMAARLIVRASAPHPALPAALTARDQLIARLGHAGLYALLLLMPVSGVIFIAAHGHAISWFGLVQLPALFSTEHHRIGKLFALCHLVGGIALTLLIAAHLYALHKHARQGVRLLPRMWR